MTDPTVVIMTYCSNGGRPGRTDSAGVGRRQTSSRRASWCSAQMVRGDDVIEMLANAPGKVAVHVDETPVALVGCRTARPGRLRGGRAAALRRFRRDAFGGGGSALAVFARAGAGTVVDAGQSAPGRVVPVERASGGQRFVNMGYAVALVGMLAHLGSIVTRGIATSRAPGATCT